MIYKLKTKLEEIDRHTVEVVRKSMTSSVVKMSGVLISLMVSIFLGREIGAEGLGVIDLANRITGVLLVFSVFGMDKLLLKNIAISYHEKDEQNIADLLYTATFFNGVLAVVIASLLYAFAPFICQNVMHSLVLIIPLKIAAVMIVPQTFSRIFAPALNGYGKVWQSNLVNETLSAWVVGLGLTFLWLTNMNINVVNVAILYGIARLLVLFSVYAYWKKLFTFKGAHTWKLSVILKPALALLLVAGTSVIATNTDSVMLGWLSDTREVGIYSVAIKLAAFMMFFLQISNTAISPKLAALYANGQLAEMELMVHRVTRGLIGIALIFLASFIFGGSYILGLWGKPEFKDAYWVLVVLCLGQFFNISTGCAGMLLIMCGYERLHGYLSLCCVMLNVVLNFFFINSYGAMGAAASTAITIVVENAIKVILANNYVGVLTIPMGIKL